MRFNDLVNRAKDVVEKRGGTDQLKKDAEQLKNIASGPGSAQDKAKRAADHLKNPPGGGQPERSERPEGGQAQRPPREGSSPREGS